MDGSDSTDKIIEMIKRSKFFGEIKVIFLNAIVMAGLNVINLNKLHSQLNMPILCITRKKPRINALKNALNSAGFNYKIPNIEIAHINNLFVQFVGLEKNSLPSLLKIFQKASCIPEPLRLAHLISSGISLGESRGRV